MTLNVTSPSAGTPRQGHTKQVLAAVAGAALALATLAGVAVWQSGTSDDAGEVMTAVAAGTARAAVVASVGRRTENSAPIYYLVGTPAEAETTQRAVAEADVLRAHLGEAVVESTVLLVASAEDEVVLQQLTELDAIRDQLGLPLIRFVDLRTPRPNMLPLDPTAYSDAEMYQRWQQAQGAPNHNPTPCAEGAAPDPTAVRDTCR